MKTITTWVMAIAVLLLALPSCTRPEKSASSRGQPADGCIDVASSDGGAAARPRRKLSRVGYSLIELIANPLRFQGAKVAVHGYLELDNFPEGHRDGALYLDREAARAGISTNSLPIRFGACEAKVDVPDRKPPEGELKLPPLPAYVIVRGTFEPTAENEVFGGGTICNITGVLRVEEREPDTGRTTRPPVQRKP
jgi:hypothetical protein